MIWKVAKLFKRRNGCQKLKKAAEGKSRQEAVCAAFGPSCRDWNYMEPVSGSRWAVYRSGELLGYVQPKKK